MYRMVFLISYIVFNRITFANAYMVQPVDGIGNAKSFNIINLLDCLLIGDSKIRDSENVSDSSDSSVEQYVTCSDDYISPVPTPLLSSPGVNDTENTGTSFLEDDNVNNDDILPNVRVRPKTVVKRKKG
eukprot:GHVU01006610.1.p1 GENE.GHVU01006610.1~~GHVU01006610.1.p1  ORF type:complete len:129 (-),score=6.44 GHVU01006610.1:134-520(-)